MKKLLSILAAVGLTSTSISSVVACGGSNEHTLGLIVATKSNPYYQVMIDAAESKLNDYNKNKNEGDIQYKLNVYDSSNKTDIELTNINNAITKGDEALLMGVVDSSIIDNAKAAIANADVPLVTIDRDYVDDTGKFYGANSFETNNTDEAVKLYNNIINDWNNLNSNTETETPPIGTHENKAKIFILRGTKGTSVSNTRFDGFYKQHENTIELSNSNTDPNGMANGDFDRTKATAEMDKHIQKGELDQTQILFAENDEMAYGTLTSIRNAGVNSKAYQNLKKGKLLIVGYDGVATDVMTDITKWSKKDGLHIFSNVKQNPGEMTNKAIDYVIELLKGDDKIKITYDTPAWIEAAYNLGKDATEIHNKQSL